MYVYIQREGTLQIETKWKRGGLWERTSGAIKAAPSVQSLRANRASDMNLAQALQPLTSSQKPLGGAVKLLSSSFCPTLPDLLCLPSAQVHYIHLFHRYNSLHINYSFSPLHSIHSLSLPSIHGPEQSHRFIGRTWPYCVRMWGWEKEKEGEYAPQLGQHWKADWSWGQHGGERTGARLDWL